MTFFQLKNPLAKNSPVKEKYEDFSNDNSLWKAFFPNGKKEVQLEEGRSVMRRDVH